MKTHQTLRVAAALAALGLFAVACGGGSEVSQSGDPVMATPTPTPEPPTPTPAPTPRAYTIRFTNLHIYNSGDTFGNGDTYWTFALNDTVRYSGQMSVCGACDYNPEDYGVTSIDFTAADGDPVYIYADGYDVDPGNVHDPMGTVNDGWYAGDEMIGVHSVSAQNPYNYDLTYSIEPK